MDLICWQEINQTLMPLVRGSQHAIHSLVEIEQHRCHRLCLLRQALLLLLLL